MVAKVKIKSKYGTARIYPENTIADLMLQITQFRKRGNRSISLQKLELFMALGHSVQVVECDKSADAVYLKGLIRSLQGEVA